jgi:hypothetical protein
VAALAIQLPIQSKDHDIRYLIRGKGIGSRQSPFVLDHWIFPVGEEMHDLESSGLQMYSRHVWNESLVFDETSPSCKNSDPFTGILSRNE